MAEPYAVKIIRQRQLKRIRNGEENVRREINIMQRLRHPNVLRLHEVLTDEDQEKLYVQPPSFWCGSGFLAGGV